MARYILVDDDAHAVQDRDLDLDAFIRDNALGDDEAEALRDLPRGKPRTYGGGAAPLVSVIKVEA